MNEKIPRVPISTGEGQTAYKRQLAYDQLGIDPMDVQIVPMLSVQFRRIARAARNANLEGRSTTAAGTLCLLEGCNDPDAKKLVAVFHSIPASYRKLLPPEAYCLAAGVLPTRALELMTVVAVQRTANASMILSTVMHPRVVLKTIEMALTDGGAKERRMLHVATGFIRA